MVVQATLAHIQEHLDMVRNMDQGLAAILKQQPLPPPQAPMQGPPQGQQPAPGPTNVSPIMDGTPVETQQAGAVNQPSMPKNPATGQQFNPNQQ